MPKQQPRATDKILKELKTWGLSLPGAHSKAPWPGHDDLAVNDKTFAYLSSPGEPFGVGCKLPKSGAMALMLPFAEPMAYGLGKSGWVSATFPDDQPIDIDMVRAWILESYRAQAPKKLAAQLDGDAPAKQPAAKKKRKRR
jgi:predicted DNA-binding protein (MmcQ/YjbR family)